MTATGEQRLGVLVDRGRREARLHRAEHLEDRLGRGDRFADVDRVDDVVGELGPGLDPALLDQVGEDHIEFGEFAIDLGLARRLGDGVGDHRTRVGRARSSSPRSAA